MCNTFLLVDGPRRDGFYSVNVGTDKKIIAINSNMCLTYNFYLFLQWEVSLFSKFFRKFLKNFYKVTLGPKVSFAFKGSFQLIGVLNFVNLLNILENVTKTFKR